MVLPSGTVTFLFTDIEGSTGFWETAPEGIRAALERHDAILHGSIEAHGGRVFSTGVDGLAAVFARSGDAVAAAAQAQAALAAEVWPEDAPVRVRMAVHTGEAIERDGDYFGPALNRAARLMGMGNGGQVLVSHATEQLVQGSLPSGLGLMDLGEHRLRDLSRPERIFQLRVPGCDVQFPPLRSLDAIRTNLPVQLTSFVGREEDVKAVGALVGEHRVVTVTGVGGVGKTRLALQVAAEELDVFPDGVWLVELAPLGEPSRVVEALAAALPRPGRGGRNPCLPHRARPGRRLGDWLRGPRQRRAAWRARHLATPGGQSPRPASRIGRGRLALTPTPGPRTAMRRSDRAIAVMARRTPWILRGMARLAPANGHGRR